MRFLYITYHRICQVVLYQSVADGTIAIKTEEDDDFGTCKESYSDNEIISGVSFKMK